MLLRCAAPCCACVSGETLEVPSISSMELNFLKLIRVLRIYRSVTGGRLGTAESFGMQRARLRLLPAEGASVYLHLAMCMEQQLSDRSNSKQHRM